MVKIDAYHDGESWCARGIGVDIFTQGDTLDELIANIKEAVALHFEDEDEIPDILVLSEIRASHVKAATGQWRSSLAFINLVKLPCFATTR